MSSTIISIQKEDFLIENPLFKLISIPNQKPYYAILNIYLPSYIKIKTKNGCQTIPVLAKETSSTK